MIISMYFFHLVLRIPFAFEPSIIHPIFGVPKEPEMVYLVCLVSVFNQIPSNVLADAELVARVTSTLLL
jgi:hypothetical protein